MTDSTSEVAARQTRTARRARAVSPTLTACSSSAVTDEHQNVGIHAALQPTQQSEQRRTRLKGPSGVPPARQGKAVVWSENEMEELRKLVLGNTGRNGQISWNSVEEAWKDLNLTKRTKASLSSKWRDVKTKSTIPSNNVNTPTQDNEERHSNGNVVTTDTLIDAGNNDDGNDAAGTTPTIEKNQDQNPNQYVASCIVKGNGKLISLLERGEKLDKQLRKLLVELKSRYKASCVARLYLPTEIGGCGLKSIKETIEEAIIYTWAYVCTRKDLKSSLNLFINMANRGKRCVVSDARSILETYNIKYIVNEENSVVVLNEVDYDDAKTLSRLVVQLMRTVNNTRRYTKWKESALAGRVLRSPVRLDEEGSFTWLKEGKLSSIAVRNALAAQEGCLITRTHPSQQQNNNRSCRKCKYTDETIEHVLSSCSKWLPTLYIARHDSTARNIHYKLCQKYGFKPSHYSQEVESVLENDSVNMYWNQPIQTQAIIHHNKPDIVIFHKKEKTAVIVELAISWFTGIEKQKEIKEAVIVSMAIGRLRLTYLMIPG